MKKYLLATFLLALFAHPLLAQKKKTNAAPAPAMTAEQLVQSYRFDEAARVLQREIDAAERAGKNTGRLEAELKRANLGADMLRGVERVVFVDSFKIARAAIFDSLKLSGEAGKVVSTAAVGGTVTPAPAEMGRSAYINELGDRLLFSAADSTGKAKNIWAAYRNGRGWSQAQPLSGLQIDTEDQDCPFMMPDGVTLYFSAQGGESLGGYDIFVTRYNTGTKEYLKAENLGMPFNSPANDYLLAIDEASALGWLVTDRNQSADTVCVYVFIPTDTREIYELSAGNRSEVVSAARLLSIASTRTDENAVAAARERLRSVSAGMGGKSTLRRRYVINDGRVYHSLGEFRSGTARRIAEQADKVYGQIETLSSRFDELQKTIATQGRTTQITTELKQISDSLPELREQYRTLCKNMRAAELK